MGRLAKVTFSTVDEFKRSGGEAINEEELKITSLAALATDVSCSEVEGKLAFHRVSLTKHCHDAQKGLQGTFNLLYNC